MSWNRVIAYLACLSVFALLVFGVCLFNLKKPQLLSPIINASKLSMAVNVWFPETGVKGVSTAASTFSDLTAEAAFFIDTQTGEVLFEKNSQQPLPIASLTKIMTAVVALENKTLGDSYTVSKRASEMEPDKMFLSPGEKLSLEELLDGMFLVSGNDASEVIAEGTTGRREEFINLMNSKARQLGMNNTLFINPSGLEEDGQKQFSTAYDLAILSRYAIRRFPHLIEISSQPNIYIPPTDLHNEYNLYSGINLLTTMPGVVGFKTGFTPETGLTLVTLARRGNKEVLGILLGSTDRRDDARALLEYAFKRLGVPEI